MPTVTDIWYFAPFNALFFAVFAAFILLLVVGSLILRKKSERTRRRALVVACLVTLVGFFFYKYFLSLDTDYDRITAAMGGFNWWGELPLQLCNINMLLIPIAVTTRKKALLSFCFFVGPIGAMMALALPGNGFSGYSLLLPRMLGYYGTHFAIIIEALAIATLGFYRPSFRDLPLTMLTIFGICLAVFGIDMLLRTTGLHAKANYFYAVETEGNALLELFYRWIPLPFLYLLPSLVILAVYVSLVMLCFTLVPRLFDRRAPRG